MSQLQNAAEIDDLLDEIAFQQTLLASIDDSVNNREEAQNEVKAEIRTLTARLRVKQGITTTASNSRIHPSSQNSTSASANASYQTQSQKQSTGGDLSSEAAMNGYLGYEQNFFPTLSSTASTPNSADSLGDLLSPSQMNLPTRKRSHSKHLDGALASYEQSRRASPSQFTAARSRPSTSSSSSDEFPELSSIAERRQKEHEAKIKQEKLDAEFARSLENSYQDNPSIRFPAASGPSAFDRMSGIRQQPSSSTSSGPSGRGSSWNNSTSSTFGRPTAFKVESQSTHSNMKREEPTGFQFSSSVSNGGFGGVKREEQTSTQSGFNPYAYGNIGGVKAESSQDMPSRGIHGVKTEQSSLAIPGSFRESSSDPSDSDIEIIPASAFRDNGRHQPAPQLKPYTPSPYGYNAPHNPTQSSSQRPPFTPAAQLAGNAGLQRALYGNQQFPDWTTPDYLASQNGMGDPSTIGNSFGGNYSQPYGSSLGYTVNGYQPVYGGDMQLFNNGGTTFDPLSEMINRAGGQNFGELQDYLKLNDPSQLDYIMNDPRKTNEEIKALLENIRPDEDLPPEDREGTPEGLVYPLYEHQKLALTWLKNMEQGTNKGGILADDMGLGKTISALALILSRPSTDRSRKTTLIVGPVALIRQWDREIKKKIKVGHRLSTHMLHGQSKKRTWDELRTFDVVLTSYGTVGAEFKRMEKWIEQQTKNGNREYDESPMRKLFPLLGAKSLFYRVILDEAQCIKNKNTMASKAACHLKSLYRLCLTGTPMMNNVGELYSLIHFLRIRPYNEYTRFQHDFSMLTKGDSRRNTDSAMRKLQAVLKAILLRRVKTSLIDGKPIITLPPKTEEVQHVVFDEEEQAFYSALESKTQLQFNRYMKAGTVGKNYSNILVLLLRLRQACCHPHLIQDFEEASPAGIETSVETMMELAKSLDPDVVTRLLDANDAFECPVCYDAVQNPRIVTPCGHDTCSECLTKITDQAVQQNVADGNDGAATASKCPTCRGALVLSKVIDYATFKKVHKPDPVNPEDEKTASDNSDSSDSESDSETGSETEDDEANSDGDLRNFIVYDDLESTADEEEDPVEDGDDEADFLPKKSSASASAKPKPKSKGKENAESKEERRRRKNKKGKKANQKKEKKEKKATVTLAELKKEANRSAEGRRRYLRYLRKNWQPSAKVTKCVELLEQFLGDGQKTIIFSQFVSLLDLLQVPIDEKNWNCLRYDGGMSAEARNDAINRFTDSSTHNIMLISLKAGNAGLNLTAASRVIILDPFWNPFIEMQAVDRAYRIGQQRSVEVHRILIEKTVEDRIIELQERKRKLVESALDEGANREVGRLGVQQLAFLFGVGGG